MKLTKITHCTLLFEYENKKVLTDPGKYSIENYRNILDIDYLVLTDTHTDHYNKEGLLDLINKNPGMNIILSPSVQKKFQADFPDYAKTLKVITEEKETKIGNTTWTFGLAPHIQAYPTIKPEEIIWYQIENKFFYSGDTLKTPKGKVDLMGVNVIAPFGSMREFLDHALQSKPMRVINLHDGYLNKDFVIGFYAFVKKTLEENGIKYEFFNDGDVTEI